MESAYRESILKEAIGRNPGIYKTDLQKLVQGDMAKDTSSKMLGTLVEDGKIVERQEGKKIRYFPRDAAEDGLSESLAAALDGYVKDLCAMKGELGTYPYYLLNVFNNEIPRQRDDLMRLKKRLEDELRFEHTVEDVMREHDRMHNSIAELLGMRHKLVDHDTRSKIYKCVAAMSSRLRQMATKRFELIKKRKSYGKGETRDSLNEEIARLDSDIGKILDQTADLHTKIRYLRNVKPRELWGTFPPQPVRWLQRVEKERTSLQSLVEEALDAKTEMQGDDLERWQDAETGLVRIRGQLSDMKNGLAETEEVVTKLYIGADLYEQQKELYSLVDAMCEMYRP